MPTPDGLIARIERDAGVPDLADVLAGLPPTDLQSLLIAVHARRAASVTPRRLVEQYATNPMGDNVSSRKSFIQENALDVRNLDI